MHDVCLIGNAYSRLRNVDVLLKRSLIWFDRSAAHVTDTPLSTLPGSTVGRASPARRHTACTVPLIEREATQKHTVRSMTDLHPEPR